MQNSMIGMVEKTEYTDYREKITQTIWTAVYEAFPSDNTFVVGLKDISCNGKKVGHASYRLIDCLTRLANKDVQERIAKHD
jgi:hypothetical protein